MVSYHLISVGGATDAGGDANKNGDAKVSNRTSQFEKAPRPKHRAGLTEIKRSNIKRWTVRIQATSRH